MCVYVLLRESSLFHEDGFFGYGEGKKGLVYKIEVVESGVGGG